MIKEQVRRMNECDVFTSKTKNRQVSTQPKKAGFSSNGDASCEDCDKKVKATER